MPSKGVLEYHEKGGTYYFCEVEDESDFLEFKLIATADPCIYAIKGTTSPLHTHSEECEEPAGPATCRGTKTTYHEYERQTRITGDVVDLRDSERGPFRPSVEYRNSYKRCEKVRVDCYGNETRRDFVCTGTDDLARFGFDYVSGDGWMNAGPQLWMELKDGQKSRYYTGGSEQGLNYILHIDEAPFRRLEQRCDEYDASRSPFEPAGKAKEQN